MAEPSAGLRSEAARASDIRADHWTLRLAPRAARPYLRLIRLDRPIGTWLLLLPGWWGLALAAATLGYWPNLYYALLFAVGALLMRGAGCVYNDIVDHEFDARVARTATRPIPAGEVTLLRAWLYLGALLLVGLIVLLQLPLPAILLGAASLLLVAGYPFMKRITYWPQAWLGLTFNWGVLVAWAAETGGLGAPAFLLYAGGIAWTLGYDTIYAHQDKEDDVLIGVKSSALRLGERTKPWLAGFYALACLLFLAAGLTAGAGWPYGLGLAAMAAHFAWQVRTLDTGDAANCLARFKANRTAGLLLLAGAIAAGQVG